MIRLLSILIFILCIYNYSKAQEPFMHHITDDDGLPSMEVYNIIQDHKGFIWIGTDNGLCRFDGINFKIYSHPKQRGRAFSRFKIDKKNRIWMVNFSGQIFYLENDTLKLFEQFEEKYKSGISRFDIDEEEVLWISSIGNPLFSYDLKTNKWKSYPYINCNSVQNIIVNNQFDIAFSLGYIQSVKNPKKMIRHSWDGMQYAPSENIAIGMRGINGGANNISLSILKPDFSYSEIDASALPNNSARIIDFITFSLDDCWLLTYDGAYHLAIRDNKIILKGHYLKQKSVSWICRDREGNYLISTLKNGIFMIPSMNVWQMNTENSNLPDNRITRIEKMDNQTLIMGTGNGNLFTFNTHAKKIIKNTLVDNDRKDIEAIKYDAYTGDIYTQTTTLHKLGNNLKQIITFKYSLSSIKDLSIDKYGMLAIANSFSGMLVNFNPNADKSIFHKQYKFIDYNTYSVAYLYQQRSYTVHINEEDSSILQGCIDGLYYFKNGKVFSVIDPETKSNIYANDIIQDPTGYIWISTMQQGIYTLRGNKVIAHYSTSNGLISNFTRCLTYDAKSNQVWFATNEGVQSLNVITKQYSTITRADGLVTNDVLDMEIVKPYLYIASSKGLQWINIDSLYQNTYAPDIYLTEFSINETDTPIGNNYVLSHTSNTIKFSYIGIAGKARKNIKYKYRLVGLDTGWITANYINNFALFNSLSPGDYTFEVYAINEDGIESTIPAKLSFSIRNPYWQTWWFYASIALGVILILTLLFYLRIQFINRRNLLQRKNVELELEKSNIEKELRTSQLSALKVQMNPHFIFNALNSIQEYILTNEKKLANSYLGKFSDLMRLYLDMSNKQSISLDEEIKALKLYLELEAMRFEDNFIYELSVDENLSADEVMIPPMIIQPFVENAIKHGLLHKRTDRKLNVVFNKGPKDSLICVVTDNGIGRKQSEELNAKRRKQHTSFATGATKKRLEILNYGLNKTIGVEYDDLVDTHGNALGTKVTITI
jgi:ligand-binding sensor domain-containing protein